ncbi:MAG: VOC family protein [Fusobacteriaceae bacterium]|jgi:lactoylglutathione lyase|nr:VOC family protein [Fusobacteriaceae bacterium]
MKFKLDHFNINVLDMNKSLDFYEKALGLKETRRKNAEDGSYVLSFLGDGTGLSSLVELTWLRDRKEKYDLGDEEFHLAFVVDDFDGAYNLHKEMNVIKYENKKMGVYFITDPDGYWIEIIPTRK